MKKTAVLLMIITILTKILGFGREIALSYYYGASVVSDAYLISLTIPSVIFSFIGVGIYTGFIPLYTEIREKESEDSADLFASNLMNILIVVSTIIVIIGLIFTEKIVLFFASGFDDQALQITVKFSRITFWGIYLTGIMYIFRGYLEINKKFLLSAAAAIPMNLIIILSIIFSAEINFSVLSLGYLLALASQFVLLIPSLKKLGFKYRFFINLNDTNIKKLWYVILSLIIGVSINQINVLIDRNIASTILEGGISVLNYASRVNDFVQGVFITSILLMVFPILSNAASRQQYDKFNNTVIKTVNSTMLLVVPSTIGIMFLANPIIDVLFGRGKFGQTSINMTSYVLVYYSIGAVGVGLREVLSKAFYAKQDTKTPMINAALGMAINIVLNIILSRYLGLNGLALATSISAIITSILLFVDYNKKIGEMKLRIFVISILKILFASLMMGTLAIISYSYTNTLLSQNISLLFAIGIAIVSYCVIIIFLKIEEVDDIIKLINKKLRIKSA